MDRTILDAGEMVNAASDQFLMQAVKDGEVGKLGILFERHHSQLFNFLLRLTGDRQLSEDLVQEVFVRVLKYRHTYRGESQFTTWMFQIARHAHIDHFRKYAREDTMVKEEADEMVSPQAAPVQQIEQEQEAQLLREALARLPEEKREVLLLSRFHHLKYEEIAKILNCSVGAVKGKVFRAVQDLRERFIELTGERVS